MAQATRQSSLKGELQVDVEIKASANMFHHMLARRPQDIPKAAPDVIQRCGVHEGEFGKVGSIIFWNYATEFWIFGQYEKIEEKVAYPENLLTAVFVKASKDMHEMLFSKV